MRNAAAVACLALLPLLGGCTCSDALFNVFGDYYSGGGYTRAEKEYDYNRRVEASQRYTP